jgi:hypothetical protein
MNIQEYFDNIYINISKNLEGVHPKSANYFYAAIIIRLIVPIVIFKKYNPFFSILFNEIVLDGIFSPHHFAIHLMPENLKKYANHFYTDKPLDTWGFLLALQPVVNISNKYYSMFEDYRGLIVGLFVYRLIGYILFLKTKVKQVFLLFPNFFFTIYTIITFFRTFFPKTNKSIINKFIIIGFIFSIIKEVIIHCGKPAKQDLDYTII